MFLDIYHVDAMFFANGVRVIHFLFRHTMILSFSGGFLIYHHNTMFFFHMKIKLIMWFCGNI